MRKWLTRPWFWLVAVVVLIVGLLSTVVEVRFGPPERPKGSLDDLAALPQRTDTNILFVLVDMLRADRLGSYGYERPTSPEIDALASSGLRFARHLSQSSWTKASMASLWTAMYPAHTGVTRFDDVVPDEAPLPAEVLKEAGFHTSGIWRNGWVEPRFGFAQGFDAYTRPATMPTPPSVRAANPTLAARSTDADVLQAAVEFLRIHGHKRWFLYLHLMDVHEYVYDEQTALFGGTYADIYDNSVRRVDTVIGALMGYLREMGLASETIVVVGSDHGEAFLERGHEGHARQVYRETTEVPLVIALPFRLDPGIVVDVRTRNVDIWPTLFELVGLPVSSETDGRSLLPDVLAAARGEAPTNGQRTAVAHLDQTWGQEAAQPRDTVAIVDGPHRYVRISEGARRLEQLFDADRDPAELKDVAAEDPETLERLRGLADAYLESEPTWGDAPEREIGELELNQLRALGYAVP